MPSFASPAFVQADAGISPTGMAMIAILGCFVVLLVIIIIGFSLVASSLKKCCPSAPDRRHSGPAASASCQCQHAHHRPPARRGLAHPVASILRCPACQNLKVHRAGDKASRPVPQVSVRSPAPQASLPPPYARHSPTGASPSRRSTSSSVTFPRTATPTTPPFPPLGHGARVPTATLRPAVW